MATNSTRPMKITAQHICQFQILILLIELSSHILSNLVKISAEFQLPAEELPNSFCLHLNVYISRKCVNPVQLNTTVQPEICSSAIKSNKKSVSQKSKIPESSEIEEAGSGGHGSNGPGSKDALGNPEKKASQSPRSPRKIPHLIIPLKTQKKYQILTGSEKKPHLSFT